MEIMDKNDDYEEYDLNKKTFKKYLSGKMLRYYFVQFSKKTLVINVLYDF